MSPEQVREDILSNNFKLSIHAKERMSERNVTRQDIVDCAQFAVITTQNDKIIFDGLDSDGTELKVVCVYIGVTLIITVY